MQAYSSIHHHREKLWVFSIFLLAFLIRFLPALVPHFWYDEVYTVAIIHSPFKTILNLTAQDAHPPLYYFWVKCFAAAGRRLGGPFATLAWLRMSSILPGMLACLLGWWMARRHWGERRALWTLALFAVSPALTYYSVELRQYSSAHCLLLAGMVGLLHAADPKSRRPGAGILLFTASMTLALYVHYLAALYLGVMGLIGLVELALRRRERRALGLRAAAGAAMIAASYLPWLPTLLQQRQWFNQQTIVWMPTAAWHKLPATFCWYLPFGLVSWEIPEKAWAWGLISLIGLGLLLLGRNALGRWRTGAGPGATASGEALIPDRLLAYAATLTVLPLLAAFILTHLGCAKIFLVYRYNMLAAPFFNLLVLGLIFTVARRGLRAGLLAGMLAVSLGCGIFSLWQKTDTQQDIQLMARDAAPELSRPVIRLYWLNPIGLPWLSRNGSFTLGSFEDALAGRQGLGATPADIYFISYAALARDFPFMPSSGILLQKILERRGAPNIIKPGTLWWSGVWRVKTKELPVIAAAWQAGMKALAAQRNSIKGGQVILPDDPAFLAGRGWSCLDLNAELMPDRWTQGPRQRLDWAGPAHPGRYRMQVRFWRSHPWPEKEITVRHRLPGAADWSAMRAGPGAVTLAGEVTTSRPGEMLRLEIETPTWIPAEHLPGSDDRRPLGMTLIAIELRPLAAR